MTSQYSCNLCRGSCIKSNIIYQLEMLFERQMAFNKKKQCSMNVYFRVLFTSFEWSTTLRYTDIYLKIYWLLNS